MASQSVRFIAHSNKNCEFENFGKTILKNTFKVMDKNTLVYAEKSEWISEWMIKWVSECMESLSLASPIV